jgi:hypothetical protein
MTALRRGGSLPSAVQTVVCAISVVSGSPDWIVKRVEPVGGRDGLEQLANKRR